MSVQKKAATPMSESELQKLKESVVAKKGQFTDEERKQLMETLDADIEAFTGEMERDSEKAYSEQPPMTDEEFDKLSEELLNHPAFIKEIDLSKPLNPAAEALMALKYENDAESYKDEGNHNFKIKKYRWAIDNYTEGIKVLSPDREINAILYSNRAAAHSHLGNFRSALRDVTFAVKFKPDHIKAIHRGAQCCMEIKKFEAAMRWCDNGLKVDPKDQKLLDIRQKALKGKQQQARDRRKEAAKERKEMGDERVLLNAIQERGVTLAGIKPSESKDVSKLDPLLLSSLESTHPSGAKVHVNQEGRLQWPVLFLYPEYGESDFIEQFDESSSFEDHLNHMFGPGSDKAPWDKEGKYSSSNLEIYFENKDVQKLFRVKPDMTLAKVLKNKKYIVYGGTPGFIILVKDSDFAKTFLDRYLL